MCCRDGTVYNGTKCKAEIKYCQNYKSYFDNTTRVIECEECKTGYHVTYDKKHCCPTGYFFNSQDKKCYYSIFFKYVFNNCISYDPETIKCT